MSFTKLQFDPGLYVEPDPPRELTQLDLIHMTQEELTQHMRDHAQEIHEAMQRVKVSTPLHLPLRSYRCRQCFDTGWVIIHAGLERPCECIR